jgi:transcriptional regulator with XRE-family HTH domain
MDDLVARAIREQRQRFRYSIRELARRAGISAASLSRIEAGEVKLPAMETLGALARALDRNPRYLWIVSGHIAGQDARSLLERAVQAEGVADARDDEQKDWMVKARSLLARPSATDDEIRALALEVFVEGRTEEELWWDAYLEPLIAPLTQDLRDLVEAYEFLNNPERKRKVREYLEDQSALDLIETRRAMGEEI